MTPFAIEIDDPRAADVYALLERHLDFCRATSPPEDVHAPDLAQPGRRVVRGRPAAGERDPGPRWQRGVLARSIRRNAHRDELVRARTVPDGLDPVSGQESHMIVRAASADALVHVPRGEGEIPADGHVRFFSLD